MGGCLSGKLEGFAVVLGCGGCVAFEDDGEVAGGRESAGEGDLFKGELGVDEELAGAVDAAAGDFVED